MKLTIYTSLCFLKTYCVGEFDLRVTRLGGTQLNAYTSTDRTVYLQSLPSQFLDEIATLPLHLQVKLLEIELGLPISYKHVLRDKNTEADALVKEALSNV
ncbi:MAG: Peptidase M16 inactive domain family [Candidatus Roizmanbacteria bacterium GW2011_GWA2_37_7]|uniref:Peptidase M16 inactive domain family n=1 Tax=Candidatus Roizmanbacteria bacterium GW2011_GWA2_37_7 TaxID=1618481 RepID=A0A0G0HJZ7_9BACT|nr:MAG: Peptidase M16 inactive domain family [Candidatus Roizmanbacteria bacterium GW2011_GWA2_37_7]